MSDRPTEWSIDFDEYVAAAADALWRWSEDGSAIIDRRTGRTILVREELVRILVEANEPRGVPVLEDLVWLHHAWRANDASQWPAPGAAHRVRAWRRGDRRGPWSSAEFRRVVRALPAVLPPERSRAVIDRLRDGDAPPSSPAGFGAGPSSALLAAIDDVARDTGAVPARESARIDAVVERLGRTGGLAWLPALVEQFLPLADLPGLWTTGTHAEPSGVGEISTRGNLDRLLLSELAHEPEVLAARIAQNEALFRRSPPSRERSLLDRWVLVDNGVRQWGTRRAVSVAIAFALARTTRGNGFVADASQPLRWRSLGELEAAESLAASVAPTLDARSPVSALAESVPLEDEIVVITSSDAWLDPGFRAAFDALLGRRCFVIAVHGSLALALWQVDGRRTAARLLSEQAIDVSALETDREAGRLDRGDGSWFRVTEAGHLDRGRPGRAPTRVADHVARGEVLWMSAHGDRVTVISAPSPQRVEVVDLSPAGRETRNWVTSSSVVAVEDLDRFIVVFEGGLRPAARVLRRSDGRLEGVYPGRVTEAVPAYPAPRLFRDEHDRLCHWAIEPDGVSPLPVHQEGSDA